MTPGWSSAAAGAARRWVRRLAVLLTREPVLSLLLMMLVALQLYRPQPWHALPLLVDWQTVMTLAGLLILTTAVESSGFLMWFAHRVVRRIRSVRALACLLVGLAALLSTILTNDVALFVVVPLLRSLHALTPLPLKRLVIFVALAVNAGSILTPFGNPQNLFLWGTSGVSFGAFVVALAPLCATLLALLFLLCAVSFRAVPLDLSGDTAGHPVAWRTFALTVVLFAAFVPLANAHCAGPGLAALASGCLIWQRRLLQRIDWPLLLVFVCMFVVLRSVAALPAVQGAIAAIGLSTPLAAYAAGAVLSQGISNVPAAIMLAQFSHDWRALAFGVSVGGFGCAIGSLANLIAVRLARQSGIWLLFHLVSLPFWLVATVVGGWLLTHLH